MWWREEAPRRWARGAPGSGPLGEDVATAFDMRSEIVTPIPESHCESTSSRASNSGETCDQSAPLAVEAMAAGENGSELLGVVTVATLL